MADIITSRTEPYMIEPIDPLLPAPRPRRVWIDAHVYPGRSVAKLIGRLEADGYTIAATPLLDNDGKLHWALLGSKVVVE